MALRRNRLPPKTTSQILRFVEEQKNHSHAHRPSRTDVLHRAQLISRDDHSF